LTAPLFSGLPRGSGKNLLRFLQREGFTVARVRGSRHVLTRGETDAVEPVPGIRAPDRSEQLVIVRCHASGDICALIESEYRTVFGWPLP